ncbi:MAG: hypothetical protein H6R19_3095 [Proteobacteria bacterium]|nr:hypothetical protein [Pseudomonadota bacterium]
MAMIGKTSLSRNTIDKWLKAPGDVEPKYRREARECKRTPFPHHCHIIQTGNDSQRYRQSHAETRRRIKAKAQGAKPSQAPAQAHTEEET